MHLGPHQETVLVLFAYYVSSAAVGALQAPDASSGKFYRWLYVFMNTLAANVTRAFATKLPNGAPNTAENAAMQQAVPVPPAGPTK